jgi:pimeloyl-ACP methyl ester carboxylesterase
VAVDLRGHGRSDALLQYYTIERFADDLMDVRSAWDREAGRRRAQLGW